MRENNQNIKIHYKMYKKGKHWVFASITASTIAIGAFTLTGLSASAEESTTVTEQTVSQPKTETAPVQQEQVASQPKTENAPVQQEQAVSQPKTETAPVQQEQAVSQPKTETAPVQQEQAVSQPKTENVPVQQEQVASQPKTETAPVQQEQAASQPKTEENPEAKQATASAPVTTTTSSTEAAKTVTTAAKEYATTTVKTSAKAKKAVAKAAAATTESNITSVTKDNFEDHFVLNGSAKNQYNKNSGTVTLTPDKIDQSGNFALNEKIDLSKSFTLKGKINLGTKSKSQGGADGIGFAFHNGDPSTIGMSGGALGIGNLVDAFGFKLDTFFNGEGANGTKGEYFMRDPYKKDNTSYGAFIYTDPNVVPKYGENVNKDEIGKTKHYAYTDEASVKEISNPYNNTFRDILFEYNGDTKMMKITYEGKVWEADITKWKNADVDAYSFIVTGSTGGSSNLQQFKIEDFSYTAAGKFTALFKSKENETLNEAYSKYDKQGVTADYSSDINSIFSDIYKQGYDFVGTDSTQTDKGEYTESKNKDDSLNVAVKFDNTPSQVIYYFDRAPGKVVIKYVDQDGNELRSQIDKTGKFGENYTSNKLSFDGYRFDTMDENSAATNGTLIRVEDNLTVIYKYIAQSTIVFSFFDEEDLNTSLKPSFDKTGDEKTSDSVNDELSTILEAIKNQGYDFKAVTTSQDNMFDENGKTITYLKEDGSVKYIFNKASGNLIVKYQDESGNEISSTSSNTEKVGTDYTTSQRDIEGYTFKEVNGETQGQYTREDTTVIYIYTKNPDMIGNLTVHYYIQDTTTSLKDSITHKGKVGESFPQTGADIEGYTLVNTVGSPSGSFTAGEQTITYYYTKNPVVEPPVVEPPVVETTCRGTACRGTTCRRTACRGTACRGTACRRTACRRTTCRGTACCGTTCRGTACCGTTC
ncbi:hypothetical protein QI30_16355, partial [Kurthia sp. 3B1D]